MLERRYRLRRLSQPPATPRGLWLRVVFLLGLLAVILLMQDQLGRSAAGCFGVLAGGAPQ